MSEAVEEGEEDEDEREDEDEETIAQLHQFLATATHIVLTALPQWSDSTSHSYVIDLLAALVDHPGHLVTKGELLDRVWPKVVVEEAALHVQVSALRKIVRSSTAPASEAPTSVAPERSVCRRSARSRRAPVAAPPCVRRSGRPPCRRASPWRRRCPACGLHRS